jgi:hypothetical protein
MAEEQLRPDIKQASDRMQNQIGAKREIRKLVEHLWEGEHVQHMVSGTYGPGNGLLVLTDRRLLFIVDGLRLGGYHRRTRLRWDAGRRLPWAEVLRTWLTAVPRLT